MERFNECYGRAAPLLCGADASERRTREMGCAKPRGSSGDVARVGVDVALLLAVTFELQTRLR